MAGVVILLLVIGVLGYWAWIWGNELLDAQDGEWEDWF